MAGLTIANHLGSSIFLLSCHWLFRHILDLPQEFRGMNWLGQQFKFDWAQAQSLDDICVQCPQKSILELVIFQEFLAS